MPYKDKTKQQLAQHQHYLANKQEWAAKTRAYRTRNREWLNQYKTGKRCACCPENHIGCLQFHHLDPSAKAGELSKAKNGWSIPRLEREIAKCILVCANCHQKIHDGLIRVSRVALQ